MSASPLSLSADLTLAEGHSPYPYRLITTAKGYIITDALGDAIGGLARETGDHDVDEQLDNALLFRGSPELRAVVELLAKMTDTPPPARAWVAIRRQAQQAIRLACPNRFVVETVRS